MTYRCLGQALLNVYKISNVCCKDVRKSIWSSIGKNATSWFKKDLEVDKVEVAVIEQLPPPTNVNGVRSFFVNVRFYRRFIKNFYKLVKPFCSLLENDSVYNFSNECLQAFTYAPIIQASNWTQPFELMCDASDFVVGVVLT